MRTLLIATAIGTFAVAVIAYACVTAVGVMADANGWHSFTIAVGPLPLMEFERHDATTSTLFGSGIMVVSLAFGLLNGALAWRLRTAHSGKPLLADPTT